MTLLQGCLGWFKYAWIKINTKLFKNTMIFNQILSYLMIWNWYLIWPGDHNFWIPKFLLPILKSILLAPKIVLILKSYMKNGEIQIKSMYLKERVQVWAWSLCSHNWILLVRTLSPVPVFWDLAPVLTLFNVLVLLKQVSGCVYILSRQHAGEFTLSLLHLGSKLKTQTISAIELDHQNLAQLKFQSLTIYKIIKFQK